MKIEMIEVYEYSELPDDAKEKVLCRERELQSYDTWWIDYLKMIFEDMLVEKGIKAYPTDELEISMSLSYSQGDGVGFYGNLDIEALFKNIKDINGHFPLTMNLLGEYNALQDDYIILVRDAISIEINRNQQGSAIIMYVTADLGDVWDCMEEVNEHVGHTKYSEVEIENERAEFESYLKDWFDDIAGEFERMGYADIEARESEECIVENLECSDIRFLKNGYMIDWAIMSEDDLKHMR